MLTDGLAEGRVRMCAPGFFFCQLLAAKVWYRLLSAKRIAVS